MDTLVIRVGDNYKKHRFDSAAASELSLGRAFTNDLIIDDPYVGKSQLKIGISSKDGYDWQLKITDHTNPVFLNKKNIEAQDVHLRSGDVITIGRTSIALYAENHAVPATREFSFTNWLHNHKFKPYITMLLLLVLFGTAMLMSYLETSTVLNWGDLISAAFVSIFMALLWASGWALAGRLLKGHYYFSSQLFFTSLCLILMLLVGDLGSYFDYIFSSPFAGEVIDWLISVALLGLLIGSSLALVSYSPRVISKGMLVSACTVGVIALLVYIYQPDYTNTPAHSVTFKPAFIPTTSAVSVDQYISNYDALFSNLSSMKQALVLEK